jgi:hypothetical protein
MVWRPSTAEVEIHQSANGSWMCTPYPVDKNVFIPCKAGPLKHISMSTLYFGYRNSCTNENAVEDVCSGIDHSLKTLTFSDSLNTEKGFDKRAMSSGYLFKTAPLLVTVRSACLFQL